jgi:hypothetical protein
MVYRLITAWLCNLFDVICTLYFYFNFDGEELNPISNWLLQWPPAFVVVKLVGMTVLVALLLYKKEWLLCQIIEWYLFIAYLLVTVYYLFLFTLV